MLLRGTYKPEAFLRLVNRYVTGGEGKETPDVVTSGMARLVYLGAGYWRGVLLKASDSLLMEDDSLSDVLGISLSNPDHTQDEIRAVELGVAILAGLEYQPR